MKKNLVYYTVSIKDEYVEFLKKSIESIDLSNQEQIDILILTDKKYFEKNLSTFKRVNTTIFLIDEPKNFDEACFSKLKIWDYPNINQYENILYLDSDILVNKNLSSVFEKCTDENKLYVVVEDYNIQNHNRIHFSLGTYKYEDLDFFQKNKIFTFNAGTFMFKNGFLMKKHFKNVSNLIEHHNGEYFTDQSFMNYYFNTYKLADSNAIVKDLDYKFVVNSNFSQNFDSNNCVMHFLTENGNKETTLERMSQVLSKMRKQYNTQENDLIHLISVNKSESKINYTTNFNGLLNIKLIEKGLIVYEHEIEVFENFEYYSTLFLGWYDIEFHFSSGNKVQKVYIEGNSKKQREGQFEGFLKEMTLDTRTEMCEIFDQYGSDKASKPSHGYLPGHNYSRFYFNLFKGLKYDEIRLFELGIGTRSNRFQSSMSEYGSPGASLRSWEQFFPNGKIFGADIDEEVLFESERIKTFYCDQNDEKTIIEMWKNENLKKPFDIIIDDAVHDYHHNIKFMENSIHKIKIGGYYIIEDVNINLIPEWYEYRKKNKFKYENYLFEFIKLNCEHNIHDNNLIVLQRKN